MMMVILRVRDRGRAREVWEQGKGWEENQRK
jgi:hypothetical protein